MHVTHVSERFPQGGGSDLLPAHAHPMGAFGPASHVHSSLQSTSLNVTSGLFQPRPWVT